MNEFDGEVFCPERVPSWLWNGLNCIQHESIRLRSQSWQMKSPESEQDVNASTPLLVEDAKSEAADASKERGGFVLHVC